MSYIGFEPMAYWLRVSYSTQTELIAPIKITIQFFTVVLVSLSDFNEHNGIWTHDLQVKSLPLYTDWVMCPYADAGNCTLFSQIENLASFWQTPTASPAYSREVLIRHCEIQELNLLLLRYKLRCSTSCLSRLYGISENRTHDWWSQTTEYTIYL